MPEPEPVKDYDAFVNGQWKATHRIPADRTRWSTFDMVARKIEKQLIQLCQQDSGPVGQIYKKVLHSPDRLSPCVQEMLAAVQEVRTKKDFTRLSWRYYSKGVQTFFGVNVQPDAKNSFRNLPHVYQSGLGLPDKSFYRDAPVRAAYKKYIADLCQLYGYKVAAEPLVAFEESLAVLHLDPAELRQVDQTYHVLTAAELPSFFQLLGLSLSRVVVHNDKLLQALPGLLARTPLSVLKDYLRFKVARAYSTFQTRAIRDCSFAFYRVFLMGQKRRRSKQVTALNLVKQWLPVHLQQLYLARFFPEQRLTACLAMVEAVVAALQQAIQSAGWMSAATKKASLVKLAGLKICVGAPEKWPTVQGQWAELDVDRCDLSMLQQSWAAWSYDQHVVQKFYQPTDRDLWDMSVYEVNASYDLSLNQMVIPAGIIQKPFFGFSGASRNFGGLGSVIGHELTHGFDDQGRKFNPRGNLENWWTQDDITAFEHRARKVREFYAHLKVNGQPVNGKLTLGENLADIGGLTLALRALKQSKSTPSPDLREFFLAYATLWRQLMLPKAAKQSLLTNPHAPDKFRVNAVVSHLPAFHQAYGHALSPAAIRNMSEFSIW